MRKPGILPRSFYHRPTLEVARELLGKTLWRETEEGLTAGRIVEVEAYLGQDDPASHAYRGPTPRSRIMFEDCGRAYVYFSYGSHCCMNVVTERHGTAGAVLLRALEPIAGFALMRRRRGRDRREDLCSGPGKLAQAMGITLRDNGADLKLTRSTLTIREGRIPLEIGISPRVGISKATDRPFRFFERGSPYVSRVRV